MMTRSVLVFLLATASAAAIAEAFSPASYSAQSVRDCGGCLLRRLPIAQLLLMGYESSVLCVLGVEKDCWNVGKAQGIEPNVAAASTIPTVPTRISSTERCGGERTSVCCRSGPPPVDPVLHCTGMI